MSRYFPLNKATAEVQTEDLGALKSVAEGWYCEYKRRIVDTTAIAKSVSSFANSYGGWIFYGIEEDPKTRYAARAPGIPSTEIPAAELALRQAVSGAINPTPYYEHAVLNGPLPELGLENDKAILAVFVPQGMNAPYLHSSGRIYRRVGDQSGPREETDRNFVDLLFERSKAQRKIIRSAIKKLPERSESETDSPCLRILIFTNLWNEDFGHKQLNFDDFKKIMSSDELVFDNFYSTSYGYMARMTQGNDPSRIIYSWHHRDWFEEIIFPFSWFRMTRQGMPYPEFQDFQIGTEFIARCRKSQLYDQRVIHLSQFLLSTIHICEKLESILEQRQAQTELHLKIQLSKVWRSVPFLDVPSYLRFISENGIPVLQESLVYGPPGDEVESLKSLSAWRRQAPNQLDDPKSSRSEAVTWNAVRIFREVCRCLGLPSEATGLHGDDESEILQQYDALMEAATRCNAIGRRMLGI